MSVARSFMWAAILGFGCAGFAFARTDSIPPSDPTRYISSVHVGPKPETRERPLCPGDSILVRIAGWFPVPCYRVRSVELVPPPYGSPLPEPPIARIVVGPPECDGICAYSIGSWNASVVLPPLPARDYRLMVQMAEVCGDAEAPPGAFHSRAFPFAVHACGIAEPCLVEAWPRPDSTGCHATLGPGQSARVTFAIHTSVALAGLQGAFALDVGRDAARITGIEPVGPAQGMRLSWVPTSEGARFVLFADHGAPIPPDSLPPHLSPPTPILQLTVEADIAWQPRILSLMAGDLLGSDLEGRRVVRCPIMTLVPTEARLCPAPLACDFNRDGRLDVRDIVLMARCAFAAADSSTCPDTSRFVDCDGDGRRDLADVICCARRILGERDCPECPPDTAPSRPAPEVRVAFGAPDVTEDTVTIPFELAGMGSLGGAMLVLDFPSDRYDAAIDFNPGLSQGWLVLSEVREGRALAGLVGMYSAQGPAFPPPLGPMMALRLALKPGKSHGGMVALSQGDFSARDGARLAAGPAPPPVAIDGAPSLAFTEARPNPFAGEIRLSLTTGRGTAADVGVYDLAGRRVATLYRGHLAAGARVLEWRGTTDAGPLAPSGVYFLRAAARGATAVRKVVRIAP